MSDPSFPNRIESSAVCPNCDHAGLYCFYALAGIPTQSNLLMATREEALAHPLDDLKLAQCSHCGFVTNLSFDPATQEHSARYEATQGYSPTFSTFAKSLAQRWVDRYQLRGKSILEIGCLNGEFVSLLCMTADANGIGIDPVLDPARTPDTGGRVRFIRDFYSEEYRDLQADFICCRHTLEHIPQTRQFLSTIRRTIGDRQDVVVCFEVPDVLRVLQEGAFWDLYYEHCSYFTPDSLTRLFQICGFEVIDIRREFDDQYIVIDARPAKMSAQTTADSADNDAVAAFQKSCTRQVAKWQQVIRASSNIGGQIALWGSGSKAVGFLTTLNLDHAVLQYVVDINPHKQGTFLPGTGQEIVAPAKLQTLQPGSVIVMNPIYRNEIQAELDQMNVNAELLTL